ncbi:hypothetical protein GQR58_027288 [Nymphon striatum]|nr:hypothetical protein GQR58_027288 [Nymphon striatum]
MCPACTNVWVRDLGNYRYPVEKIGEYPTQYGKKDPSFNEETSFAMSYYTYYVDRITEVRITFFDTVGKIGGLTGLILGASIISLIEFLVFIAKVISAIFCKNTTKVQEISIKQNGQYFHDADSKKY